MENRIYILPNKVNYKENQSQLEFVTQKSTFIIKRTPISNILEGILSFKNGEKIKNIYNSFKDDISENDFEKIINFMKKHELIFVTERELSLGDINFIEFLSQYTISLEKYLAKMDMIVFSIYEGSNNTLSMIKLLESFDLNYEYFNKDSLDESKIVLASFDITEIDELVSLSKMIEKYPGVLWTFALHYDDSFVLSPILNKENYTNFESLQLQLDFSTLSNTSVSKNSLVQNIANNEILLQLLTSIMKLNIQTAYNKSLTYDSLEKTLSLDNIYYYPDYHKTKEKIDLIKRWAGE